MFYPGETDEQEFTIPFQADTVASVVVTYKQNNITVLEKTVTELEDAEGESSIVHVHLSQEDTLLFADDRPVFIQVNVLFKSGERRSSFPIGWTLGNQYHRNVMK